MAFKRSGVRLPLAPPSFSKNNNNIHHLLLRLAVSHEPHLHSLSIPSQIRLLVFGSCSLHVAVVGSFQDVVDYCKLEGMDTVDLESKEHGGSDYTEQGSLEGN